MSSLVYIYPSHDNIDIKCQHIYLAGETNNCWNWQNSLTKLLTHSTVTFKIYNPRTNKEFEEDFTDWENFYSTKSNIQVFNFSEDSPCIQSIITIGKYCNNEKYRIFVIIENDYIYKEELTKILSNIPNVSIHSHLINVAAAIETYAKNIK